MQPTKQFGTIYCIPFDFSLKDYIIEQVTINNIKISKNYSYEGGFELPLTNDWLNCEELNNKSLLKYHSARQLRFVIENNLVIGMRLKDNINYMTDQEIEMIITLVNNVSK